MSVHSTAMNNIGINANNRLRIYVPEGKVDFYKALFSNYQDYIYPTGYIVGSFINTPIPYDIGEYSVRETTIKDRNNQDVNGWEIIEYHGADISNTFNIPITYTVNDVEPWMADEHTRIAFIMKDGILFELMEEVK